MSREVMTDNDHCSTTGNTSQHTEQHSHSKSAVQKNLLSTSSKPEAAVKLYDLREKRRGLPLIGIFKIRCECPVCGRRGMVITRVFPTRVRYPVGYDMAWEEHLNISICDAHDDRRCEGQTKPLSYTYMCERMAFEAASTAYPRLV